MPVKENQPKLFDAIALWFEDPLPLRGLDQRCTRTVNKKHGRLECRDLQATTELNDYLDWPALAQVLRVERHRTCFKTGLTSSQISYALTSLSPKQADASTLQRYWRNHWTIENHLHWSRDVLFSEDKARTFRHNSPRVLAVLRNAVLSVLHLFHPGSLKAAREYCAAHPLYALGLLSRSVSDWFT